MAKLRSDDDKQSGAGAAELTIQRRDDEALSLLVEIVTSKEKVFQVFPDPAVDSENSISGL